jgi:predicted PurR-regulated permease PerM
MPTKVETTIGVIWGLIVRLALLVALIYSLYRVRSILVAVLLSVMLTYVALPAVEFLCSLRVSHWSYNSRRFWASTIVFCLLLAVTGITAQYVVRPFVKEATDLGKTVNSGKGFEGLSSKATVWYNQLPDDIKSLFGPDKKAAAVDAVTKWLGGVLKSTVAWLQHFLDIILIPVLAFYFTLDYRSLRREFVGALPKRRRKEALYLLRHIGSILQNYIIGQIIICVIAGVVVGVALWALKMSYPLALGVLAGVTRAIPVLGPIISGLVIVVLGLLKSLKLGVALLIFFSLLQLVESKLILPKLIGHRMRLHPAVILISLLIGSEFFGMLGMFLAAPVAAIIRELARYYVIEPRTRQEAEPEVEPMICDTPSGV